MGNGMIMIADAPPIFSNLAGFAHILRHLGIRVSTAETLDAINALGYLNLTEREQVRAGLGAMLVKNYREHDAFDRAFDLHFAPEEEKQRRLEARRQYTEEMERASDQAGEELADTMEASSEVWGKEVSESLNLTSEEKETFARLPRSKKERFYEFMKSFQANPVNNPSDLIVQTIKASLNYWRYQMLKMNTLQVQDIERDPTGIEELDEVIEKVVSDIYDDWDEELIYRDMKNIEEKDLHRMTVVIRKIARKLVTRISRRYRMSKNKKIVDIRHTIRKNIRYGGIPLDLSYKTKRIQKPRLLLICDVSASMAQYSRFIMEFIYSISEVVDEIESFVFAEDLEYVAPFFKSGNFTRAMSLMVESSKQWGKSTNLYAALDTLWRDKRELLAPNVFTIIVSDGKTLATEKTATALARTRGVVKDIIWLNTLPRRTWPAQKHLAAFRKYCAMFECRTLADLEKIIGRLAA